MPSVAPSSSWVAENLGSQPPVASLAPHADALAEAVHVHWKRVREGFLAGAHVHTALGLLEKLTVRVHHPSNIDMAAAHAHAMAQETADAE